VCNKRSPFGVTHSKCRSPLGLDGLISAVPYKDDLARKLIEHLKYKFIPDISEILSRYMVEEIRNLELAGFFQEFIMVPIPLHPSRLRWRGYNQSVLLAAQIQQALGMNVDASFLVRSKVTKTQAELEGQSRRENVKNAFNALGNVTRKKFILADDVCTTGSTLTEACKALKQKGAQKVWALTFAQG
jgi:ComF family protein